jgi:hypothetical protein
MPISAIELMSQFTSEAGLEVWAYCLMPNPVHLIMAPRCEDGLRAALSEAHRRYTRHVNFRQGWRGHLWQERFHSFVMDAQYLLATVRYVERNPVAAQLCLPCMCMNVGRIPVACGKLRGRYPEPVTGKALAPRPRGPKGVRRWKQVYCPWSLFLVRLVTSP